MIPELEPVWKQFQETYAALRDALAQVPDDRLTWRPGPRANSVSGIVQHITRGKAVDIRLRLTQHVERDGLPAGFRRADDLRRQEANRDAVDSRRSSNLYQAAQ